MCLLSHSELPGGLWKLSTASIMTICLIDSLEFAHLDSIPALLHPHIHGGPPWFGGEADLP